MPETIGGENGVEHKRIQFILSSLEEGNMFSHSVKRHKSQHVPTILVPVREGKRPRKTKRDEGPLVL